MGISNQQLEQNFRATQLRVNENQAVDGAGGQGIEGGAVLPPRFTPVIPGITPQVANQLRNGDLGHSVFTWFETALPYTDPENQECAWVFSNLAPFNGQALSFENSFSDPGNPNTTLKTPTHIDYDPLFCDWDSTDGVARLNGTYTLDLPWPSNITGPGKTEFIVMIAARRNAFISLPAPFRIFCGVWDNTAGQRDFIQGSTVFTLNGGTIGSPASVTERRYMLHARTDRGYSFLSDELIVMDAPADGAFVPDRVYVSLNWTRLPNNTGILSYDVYRYDVAANQYWVLEEVTNGARSYIDQNTMLRPASGYPTGTYDHGIAYVATTSGNLSNLAINGVSDSWSTLSVPVELPPNYNQGNTSATEANQVLRIGQTQAADILVEARTTLGDTTVVSEDAQFVVEMEGLMATFTSGENTQTVELDTYLSDTEFTTVDPLTFDAKRASMLIIGGGFHGVLLDLIHASYQGGSTWSQSAEDNRILQPIAAPDGSTQGGTGIGGSGNESGGDGGIRCLAEGIPATVFDGVSFGTALIESILPGQATKSETAYPLNFVYSNDRHWCANLWRVETKDWFIECSPSHPLITNFDDRRGVRVDRLQVGQQTVVETDGRFHLEQILVCEPTGKGGHVRQISLEPGHFYIAGKCKSEAHNGGFVQSNVKPQQEPTQNQS